MKKTIYKYFFYEFLRYFTITLFALAAIVWAVQAVNFLDLVTEDGHAFAVYFLYSLLTLSKIFTKLIPFSFMIAAVLTILKLEKDNELIALWTSGLNKIHIVNHLIRISLLIMMIQIALTTALNPKLLNNVYMRVNVLTIGFIIISVHKIPKISIISFIYILLIFLNQSI